MRLISCHIKNFGKLSNIDYNFTNGINSIIEKNGAGKSTLASFIKTMLYGMDTIKASNKEFKDRTHYAPFNEQAFGGTLLFEHNKKEYRVERTFDLKSSTKDDVKIYVDKKLTPFEKEIGEEILGLDKESFDRLLFISSKDIKMETNGNMRKSLNNIIDDAIEGVDFEKIIENILNLEKKYSERKNSYTYNLKEKKRLLVEEIDNQERIFNSLTSKYEDRNKLNNELSELNVKQKHISERKKTIECWDNYNRMLNGIEEDQKALERKLKEYPNGLPKDEELTSLEGLIMKQTELRAEARAIVFEESAKQQLEVLKGRFSKGVPSEEEMLKLKSFIDEKQELVSKKYGITFSEEEEKLLNKYKEEFSEGIPSQEELSSVEEKIKEYDRITSINESEYELSIEEKEILNRFINKDIEKDLNRVNELFDEYTSIDDTMRSTPKFKEKTIKRNSKLNIISLILLIISIGLLAGGIATFFIIQVLGITLAGVGLLGLIINAFLYLKGRIDAVINISDAKINVDYLKQEELLKIKSDEIHQLLVPYSIFSQSIYVDVEQYRNDYKKYVEIVSKQQSIDILKKENNDTLSKLENDIVSFLSRYFEPAIFDNSIQKLKEDIKAYLLLDEKYKKYEKDKKENEEAILFKNNEISSIASKYCVQLSDTYSYNELKMDINDFSRLRKEYEIFVKKDKENKEQLDTTSRLIKEIDDKYVLNIFDNKKSLSEVKEDIVKIKSITSNIIKDKEKANKYKEEKNLHDENKVNLDESLDFTDRINEIQSTLTQLDIDIEEDERSIESIEDNKQHLKEVISQINDSEHKYKLFLKLEEEMKKSQKSLDDKYVSPIKDKLNYYFDYLGDLFKEQIEMGRNFDIYLNVNGQIKSNEHLSSGQRCLCALCFRFALLDNIFNGDVPFIIMDDPFMTLDKDNLLLISKMLEKFAIEKQIIYFSCHESRSI